MKTESTLAVETLSKWIISTCNKLIENAKFDKTYEGIVSDIKNESYIISYAGNSVTIKTTSTTIYSIGDKVRICIPQGNKRKAYIVVDLDKFVSMLNT